MIRESWAVQTNCAECDTVSQLSGGLCHGCRVSMGYENHVCWIDDTSCLECGAETVTQALYKEMHRYPVKISQLEALRLVLFDASDCGRTLYTSYGHLIPESSYRPRKDAP